MGRLIVLAGLAAAVALAQAAEAQTARNRLGRRCLGPCVDAVLAVEAIQGGVGLALSGGNEFPGSSSTLGRRFGTTPRVAASARLGLVEVGAPDLRVGGGPVGSASSWIPSLQGALAVGVFDGFRPRPTVGGVLSIDVMATAGIAFPSGGAGYDGSAASFGYGLRLGLVRESFSLPGLTLSAVRRHIGGVDWNGPGGRVPGAVHLDGVTATSVRGTVGREFLALGISAGLGWDRTEGDGVMQPTSASGAVGPVAFEGFEAERVLFFGGVTATWLVMQLHGELAYAAGYDERPADGGPGYDPTAGSLLATATFRILF